MDSPRKRVAENGPQEDSCAVAAGSVICCVDGIQADGRKVEVINRLKLQQSVSISPKEKEGLCVAKTNNDSSLQLKPLCRGEQKTDRAGVMSGNEEEK